MSKSTISLLSAKDFARVDHGYEDNLIRSLLDGAEKYVRNLCIDYLTEGGEWDTLPDDLQIAVLMLFCHWYDNRGVIGKSGFVSEIPMGVSALVANHRDYEGAEDE